MKRLMSGTVLLGAVLAAGACNNVTSDLSGNATRIIATPTFLIGDTCRRQVCAGADFRRPGHAGGWRRDRDRRSQGRSPPQSIPTTGRAVRRWLPRSMSRGMPSAWGTFTATANGLTTWST